MRVNVQTAARQLGISEGAVRKRVDRGTLNSEKDAQGRVFVLLDDRVDAGQDTGETGRGTANQDLVDSLQDQISYLRTQLDTRTEELRRKDHLLAALTERIPELEAADSPGEPPGEPADVQEPDLGDPDEAAEGESTPQPENADMGEPRRPWWRFW